MRLGVHRIVEVLRVFAVDGDQRQPAQIHPLGGFAGIDLVAVTLGFAHRFG